MLEITPENRLAILQQLRKTPELFFGRLIKVRIETAGENGHTVVTVPTAAIKAVTAMWGEISGTPLLGNLALTIEVDSQCCPPVQENHGAYHPQPSGDGVPRLTHIQLPEGITLD